MRTPAPPDPTLVRPPGPWVHRDLSVNGTQLHIVETGNLRSTDALILIHGFPQMWWAWRDVLEAHADSDRRVVAMDIRGSGGSDRPPTGYDLVTLARDAIGVATSVGARRAVLVGHGIGGVLAWTAAAIAPGLIRGIVPIAAPHPLELRTYLHALFTRGAATYALFHVPVAGPHRLRSTRGVRGILGNWSAPANRARVLAGSARYHEVLSAPFAAEAALRPLKQLRFLTRQERRLLRVPVASPVLAVRGRSDRIMPAQAFARDAEHVVSLLTHVALPECGHFVPEEAPGPLMDAMRPVVDSMLP
ncbi:MAG: alpha/beta hydrolase [Actinomycetaceae bacterium]|nr:alpha/beta hydrolase [Actinomycetaceae bacterium]